MFPNCTFGKDLGCAPHYKFGSGSLRQKPVKPMTSALELGKPRVKNFSLFRFRLSRERGCDPEKSCSGAGLARDRI
jgi:hypothetical protein